MKEITLGITGTYSNNRDYSGAVLTPTDLKTTSRSKIGSLLVFLIFGLAMFMPVIINAQNPSLRGVAPVNNPTGGFDIDADLYANFRQPSTATNFGDWIYDPALYPGAGRGVLTSQGIPINPLVTRHSIDLTGNADSDGFTEGSKFNMSPEDWVIEAHSNPGKDDMQNVLIHFDYDASGDLWFIMAGDRMETNGTSYLDFELFQKTVALDGTGGYTSEGTDGGRTVGDLVISIEYSNGGVRPQVFVYRWESVGFKQGVEQFDYVEYSTFPSGTVYAASNIEGPISVPYGAFGSTTYAQYAFVEAAVNLFEIIPNIDRCKSIATILVKTKASDALNAALKDVIEPIQIEVNPAPVPTISNLVACESEAGSGSASFNLNEGVTDEDEGTITFHTSQEFADEGTNAIENPENYISSGETIFVRSYNALTTCFGTAQFTLSVNPAVVTNAGPDQTVCASSPNVTLAGSVSGGATAGTWSGGTGSFNPNATTLNAVYTPSAAEITAGTVTLTLTSANPAGPCDATSDTMDITINPAVVTNAGPDQTVCASSPNVTLAGSVSGGATTGTWSGGTGSFTPNANTLNAVYTPSAAEITAGTVTLTLTSANPAGPCDATSDTMDITINPAVVTNAGPDQTVCASSPNVTLVGSVSGGATTGTWSGGTGSFNPNATTLNAVYTPSAAEITAGTVTLTLTSANPAGPCDATSDTMDITINPAVVTNAGPDQTVCASSPNVTLAGSVSGGATTGTWSGGTGSFNPNATTLNAVYTPSAAEITAGTVTLTLTSANPAGLCDATSDTMDITINPAVVTNAGPDQTVCASSPNVTLAGSVSGGATTGTWSGGTGSFNPNANTLNAVYTPSAAEITAGTVTLTLTSANPAGHCDATSDTMDITINPLPILETDEPLLTCLGEKPSIAVTSSKDGLEFRLVEKGQTGTFSDYTGPFTDLKYDTDYVLTARNKETLCETDYEFKTDIEIDIPAIVQLTVNSPTCDSFDGSTYFGSIQIDNHVLGYLYAVVLQSEFTTIEDVPNADFMSYDSTTGLISGVAVGEYYVIAKSPDGCLSAIAPAILLIPDCLTCETAFAKPEGLDNDSDQSYCFIDDNVPGFDNVLNENRWGWTNGYDKDTYITWEENPLELILYAGAGQCDITKGEIAGTVTVTFIPTPSILDSKYAGTFTVEYEALYNESNTGWFIEGGQFYIGEAPYPAGKGKNKEYTVAPGQYNWTIDVDAGLNVVAPPLNNNGVDYIYIIAHAEACKTNTVEYAQELRAEAETQYFTVSKNNNTIVYGESTKGGKTQVSSTTSSLTESSEPIFSIAPVPFKDVLNVGYLFDYTSDVTIQVFDLNGRLLTTYKDTAVNSESISSFNVDFRTKSNQIYIVRMTTDREVYSAKIIAAK